MTEKQSITDTTYQKILKRIMSTQIRPDSRISIDDLSRILSVSQTPVREALTRLASEGFIRKELNIGFRLNPPFTRAQFDELCRTRRLLEPHAIRKFMTDPSEAGQQAMVELQDMLALILNTPPSSDGAFLQFRTAEAAYYDILANETDNVVIRDIYRHLHRHFLTLQRSFSPQDVTDAVDELIAQLGAVLAAGTRRATALCLRRLNRLQGRAL